MDEQPHEDIFTWIHRLFNLSDADIHRFNERVNNGSWNIDSAMVSKYRELLRKPSTRDRDLYPVLQDMCNTFFNQLAQETPPPVGDIPPIDPICVWQGNGEKHQYSRKFKFDQPRIAFTHRSDAQKTQSPGAEPNGDLGWGSVVFPVKVALSPYENRRQDEDDIFPKTPPPPLASCQLSDLRHSKANAPPMHGIPEDPPLSAPGNLSKRIRSLSDNGDGMAPPNKKVCATRDVPLENYITETTLSTYRMFVIGVSVYDDRVRLRYYDAMGSLSTAQFNFIAETRTFMFMLFAMSLRSGEEVGYSPFHKVQRGGHAIQWKDSYFVFHDKDSGQSYTYSFDGEEPMFMMRDILYRRTLVLPVIPDGLKATPLALKFSWIDPRLRVAETKIIANILNLAPELAPYLPRLDFSRLYDSLVDLHLPRFILDPSVQLDTRHLLVSVSPRYAPLWEARNLEEFQRAFIDIVECHHRAYVKGKVLHRDISEGNLMLHRIHDDARGILLDFDNASLIDERRDVIESGATQRTGTAPFMAYDLLKENYPPHLYRHELESFFYFLMWASVHFKLSEQRHLPPVDLFTPWCVDRDSQLRRARDTKWAFLTDAEEADNYWTACGPEFQPLLETWLKPLRTMFRRGLQRCRDEDSGVVDFKTVDGFLTYKTFMKAIKVEPRRWT